jgi:hypothetical protein
MEGLADHCRFGVLVLDPPAGVTKVLSLQAKGAPGSPPVLLCQPVMSATAVAHVPKGQRTQPLVTLFDQHGADQPGDSGLAREDANDIGAPLVLFVQRCNGSVERNLVQC